MPLSEHSGEENQDSIWDQFSLRDLMTMPPHIRTFFEKVLEKETQETPEASVFEQPQAMDPLQLARIKIEMDLLKQAMGPEAFLPDYQQKLHTAMTTLDLSPMDKPNPPKKERKGAYEYRARVGEHWRYNPDSKDPQPLSRSRLDMFNDCKRCFYLRQRNGLKTDEGFSPKLHIALDILVKREFDFFREHQVPHPLMVRNGLHGVPLKHPRISAWRDAFQEGVKVIHKPTNLLVSGAPDDIWIIDGKAHVVDYKSTYTEHEIGLDDLWKNVYKRQVEFYAWLLQNSEEFKALGYPIADEAFFVYANARVKNPLFMNTLPFETEIIRHKLDLKWVEPTLAEAKACLESPTPPAADECCEECQRREAYDEVRGEIKVDEAAREANIGKLSEGVRRGVAARLKRHLDAAQKEFLDAQMEKFIPNGSPGSQEPRQRTLFDQADS